ncbi:substrate-binding domain-containing protein [Aestuariibacter sp. GS-14]|uniref:substrate-binding domain-containing protein n=1 Tax=Aestuariibacter sp. GS-14 TaxID=2590670 RepID=UPI0015E871F5|nr:substrate-binding domain-containing protein [Aestuariibacter sp. GS-14]
MSNKKALTLQDIADELGITKMTVSRYFREPERVAKATRERIARIVETQGFIQNRAPSLMSKAMSKTLGVIIPSLSNQVFASLVEGIESITQPAGFDILLAHSGYDPKVEERKVAMLLSYRVDGLLLCETTHTPKTVNMIKQAGIPVVEAMELPDKPLDMAVGMDHMQASYHAVTNMIKRGRRHVIYLAARLDNRTRLRQKGYEQAMWDAGLTPSSVATPFHSSFTQGQALMRQALNNYNNIDGVFCTNDDLAIGAMQYCMEKGIRVPSDMAVVGFNALDIGQAMKPRLTSVVTPREAIGRKSAQLLIDAVCGSRVNQTKFDLGYSLTEGSSW